MSKYWRSPAQREGRRRPAGPENGEGGEPGVPTLLEDRDWGLNRRSFLKAVGFSAGTAFLSGCGRGPATVVLSHLDQPEEAAPGRSYFYATACGGCEAGCGALVKCRDGRPLKFEGNPGHPLSAGGLCAVGQAQALGLYDDLRLKAPVADGLASSWEEADRLVLDALGRARRGGGAVRVLSRTLTSPTARALVSRLLAGMPDGRHVVYDPLSSSALLDAYRFPGAVRAAPRNRFDRAEIIVGFDADFLGTWVSPVEFAAGYRAGRDPDSDPPRFSRHVQFESRMTLTGANADERLALAPADVILALAHLADRVGRLASRPAGMGGLPACPVEETAIKDLAAALWERRGRSLVVCGLNDPDAQVLAAFINHVLGNEGRTLDLSRPSYQRQGRDADLQALLSELEEGKVAALIVLDANPAADLPDPAAWRAAIQKAGFAAAVAGHHDETASLAQVVAPPHHFLESWSDCEPAEGVVSVVQPVCHPVYGTRSVLESLSLWSGRAASAYDLVRERWRERIFPRQKAEASFEAFWNKSVHDGYALLDASPRAAGVFRSEAMAGIGARLRRGSRPEGEGLTLVLHPTVALLDGRHAGNPWLQELPDPVTKVTWDNHASLSPGAAGRLGVSDGELVAVSLGPRSVELPAFVQPGQHDSVVAVALGYGRKASERFASAGPDWLEAKPTVGQNGRVGENAAPFLGWAGGCVSYAAGGARVERVGARRPLASTQEYHTLKLPEHLAGYPGEKRDSIRETTLAELKSSQTAAPGLPLPNIWPEHPYPGRRWGMMIDLSACNGCSACVVACQAENNVPAVGKDEVSRRHDMHWLRLDRYYSDGPSGLEVSFQPMLCHHCGNAPCETVCPVLATMHSSDGLNQQVYNRCVGTRYCANNCPYKVRRFNWFKYQEEGRLSNLALNPDVTVRSRGVMEKCSFCVQRIQDARFEAKREGRPLKDGEIMTACQQTCPARAIVFGDLNDRGSAVSKLKARGRAYRVLAELNIDPAVGYLAKVRHREGGKRPGGGSGES